MKWLPFFVITLRCINSASVSVKEPVFINKSKISLTVSASSGISFSLQAFLVLPSTVTLLTLSLQYPVGVLPPSQHPVFANSCILSLIRSAMVSRSSCANTEAIYIIALPIGVAVSNCSRIETKTISRRLRFSISDEKSLTLRLTRSRR